MPGPRRGLAGLFVAGAGPAGRPDRPRPAIHGRRSARRQPALFRRQPPAAQSLLRGIGALAATPGLLVRTVDDRLDHPRRQGQHRPVRRAHARAGDPERRRGRPQAGYGRPRRHRRGRRPPSCHPRLTDKETSMTHNKEARLNRLLTAGRCLDIAVDHGVCNEPGFLDGLEDMPAVIDQPACCSSARGVKSPRW
ncbi:hypothetical protein G6F35_015682 [Rhizopus arrhizus]|nr:hypothetical protein G6F35_015682 [Rhizopus arrhizus]